MKRYYIYSLGFLCILLFLPLSVSAQGGEAESPLPAGERAGERGGEGKVERVQEYVAVIDLTMEMGVDPKARAPLTNAIIDDLVQIGTYKVIDRANRDKILKEQGFQISDCVSEECRVQVGKMLGVGKLITGSLSRIGQTYLASLQLVNVETGQVESSAKEKCACPEDKLIDLVSNAAYKLLGLPAPYTLIETPEVRGPALSVEPRLGEVSRVAMGALRVETDPEGARVFIDGNEMPERTPGIFNDIPVGRHKVEMKTDRYKEIRDILVAEGQTTSLTVKLAREIKASLKVESDPSGAMITLDGKEVGVTPQIFTNMDLGAHNIKIAKKGFGTKIENVILQGEEFIKYKAQLVRKAELKVESNPSGAMIILDGKESGITPRIFKEIDFGVHKIEIAKKGFELHTEMIYLQGEEPIIYKAQLGRAVNFSLSSYMLNYFKAEGYGMDFKYRLVKGLWLGGTLESLNIKAFTGINASLDAIYRIPLLRQKKIISIGSSVIDMFFGIGLEYLGGNFKSYEYEEEINAIGGSLRFGLRLLWLEFFVGGKLFPDVIAGKDNDRQERDFSHAILGLALRLAF